MRRLRLTHRTWSLSRLITLRPESTKDPIRYPLGYIPLDGSESIDAVYSLVKQGHFVAPLRTIESLHKAHIGIRTLCIAEHPIASIQDVVSRSLRQRELQSKVLIPRDFWTLEDFNDPELNQSYGIQNYLFDNYKWSQVLWKRFQLFVEQYFPIGEHSHLLYDEYMQLIRSFHAFEEGIGVAPLLPRTVRLHPSFGVTVPGQCSLEPLILLKRWLSNFRATFGISKALVLNAGCGAAAFAVKLSNVPMVRAVASSPRHIEACRKDTKLYPKLSNISFQVAEMFPRGDDKGRDHKYDMIVFYPDENMVSMLSSFQEDHFFAPGESGYYGSLEAFFENASAHLSDSGVVAICCTNLNSFIRPNAPHPIEYEVKVNRRFVILDYYDTPLKWKGRLGSTSSSQVAVNSLLQKNLRSELWILHKVESISHFGFFHGIPGAKPPPTAYSWKAKRSRVRQQELRDHVELMGGDWQDYKARLIHMLQQQSDVEEDDVAQSIRMSLDPSYPLELAKKAKVAVERRIRDDEEFHCDVSKQYTEQSPRERFDALHSQQ